MKYAFNNEEHVHTLDGHALTGTSSIGNVLSKPALIQWSANETIKYIKENSSGYEMFEGEQTKFLSGVTDELLDKARFAHKKKKEKAAVEGTDLHAELERFVKWHMGKMKDGGNFDEKIIPFIEWASENVKQFIASEAHCYDEDLFVGGITDCVA